MTTAERLEAFLKKAAAANMESITVPPCNNVAIAARAHRVHSSRPATTARWLAAAAAACAIVGVLFLPPVSDAIARAAHKIMLFTYFPPAHKGQHIVVGRTISLEQARRIAKIRFVEPKGLPAGYHMIWATEAPTGAARFIVTLRYESTLSGAGLSIWEMAAKHGAKSFGCHVLRWSRTSTQRQIPSLPPVYRGKTLPQGFSSIPCHGWKVGNTQIELIDEENKLTPSQVAHVVQLTR
jgi:hypothetical protein